MFRKFSTGSHSLKHGVIPELAAAKVFIEVMGGEAFQLCAKGLRALTCHNGRSMWRGGWIWEGGRINQQRLFVGRRQDAGNLLWVGRRVGWRDNPMDRPDLRSAVGVLPRNLGNTVVRGDSQGSRAEMGLGGGVVIGKDGSMGCRSYDRRQSEELSTWRKKVGKVKKQPDKSAKKVQPGPPQQCT